MLATVLSLGPKVMNESTIKVVLLLSWILYSYGQEINNEQVSREDINL